jgi:hypothetical protein
LREQKAPPKKEAMLCLDDATDEEGGISKGKSDGNKKANKKIKLEAKATNLACKIDEFVKL